MGEFAKILDFGGSGDSAKDPDRIWADHYKTQYYPDTSKLIENYKRTAFACANINANGCASKEIKLFVKTKDTDPITVLHTEPVEDSKQVFLRDEFEILDNEVIEEVIEHPVLTLLREVNDQPFLHQYSLKALTFLFMDICSSAYWLIVKDAILNRPVGIWLLPSQYVFPKKESNSGKIIDYYEFVNGDTQKKYSVDEVVQFMPLGVNNPYVEGVGPGEASYEATQLSNKLASMTSHLLDNEGRPDLLYSPKEPISQDTAASLERRLNVKYSSGRSGGWHVADEPADISPINYPPRDIARLEINTQARDEICNAYGTPIAFLDNRNISRETIFGALTYHAIFGIKPRLATYCGILNKRLIPFYDSSSRLFFGYDDPVPEDKEAKLQENVQLVMNGIKTPGEARKAYKLPPLDDPDVDILQRINTPGISGDVPRQQARDNGTAEK